MLFRNIKIALRRFYKNPIFSSINGIGLTLGLVVFFFIVQYVSYERSFNDMYSASEKSYRLLEGNEGGELLPYAVPGVVPQVKDNIPGVELAARYVPNIANGIILVEDLSGGETKQSFREDELGFVDHDFLSIFNRVTLSGDPDLTKPNTVVLTRSKALQYFGTIDIATKSVALINQFGEHDFTITGVIEDYPLNSDIHADGLFSLATFESKEFIGYNTWADMNGLSSNFVFTFFRLANNEAKDNLIAFHKKLTSKNRNEAEANVVLQSFAAMHLGDGSTSDIPTFGNPRQINFLSLLAMLILLIAWINYVNLSTAQSMHLARSIAVRKVIGASRLHLVKQQLMETFLITGFSLFSALIVCVTLQPLFNQLVDIQLDLSVLMDKSLLLGLGSFLLLTSLSAGAYVALALTKFRPAAILKGNYSTSSQGVFTRKLLVTLQFIISIAFITGTMIIYQQIKYMEHRDLGISLDRRLAILGPSDYSEKTSKNRQSFINELSQIPFIRKYSASGAIPGRGINFAFNDLSQQNVNPNKEEASYSLVFVDDTYFDIYDIDFIAGGPPTPAQTDQGWWKNHKIIINEAAARSLGFDQPAEAFSKILDYNDGYQKDQVEVSGVVEDYNHQSLHAHIEPMVFAPARNHVWFTVLLQEGQTAEQLGRLENLYSQYFPNNPFIYSFVEDYYHADYAEERKLSHLISVATIVAIFISCMGLFGLAAFTVQQRGKEIGIRKILGASLSSLLTLVSSDFLKLVLISLVFASPIAYFAMQEWLQDFAYRVKIHWWVFLLSGLIGMVIAFATISFHSLKAALANPIGSLQDE